MFDLTPSEIIIRYERKELDKNAAVEHLKSIIESEDNEDVRIDALKCLGKLKLKVNEIYSFLESLLISDQSEKVRVETANLIIHDFLEEGKPAFLHLVEHENSAGILYVLYKNLESLDTEESAQFLRQMEENLGRQYLLQFDITPKEAFGLKLISLETNLEVKDPYHTWDEAHIAIKSENMSVVYLDILGAIFPKIKYMEFFLNLEILRINDTDLVEISGLNHLSKLKHLDLSMNKIIEIKGLDTLMNLETLDLSYNLIREIKGLENLKKLYEVYFEDNDIPEEEIKNFYNNFIPFLKIQLYEDWKSLEPLKALDLCDQLISLDPKQKIPYLYKGHIYFKMGKINESIRFYKRALKLDHLYQEALYNLGIAYKSLNKKTLALKYFNLALRSEINQVNKEYIYIYLSKIYSEWKNYQKALEYAIKSIETNSEFTNGYFDVGYYYYMLENYKQAVIFFEKAAERAPFDLIYTQYLGLSYFCNKMWNKAKKVFFLNITRHPKDILSRLKLGEILIIENKLAKAKENLKKLSDFEDLPYDYCKILALDFVKLNEYDLALNLINRAIEQEPRLKSLKKIKKCILKKKKSKLSNQINHISHQFSNS